MKHLLTLALFLIAGTAGMAQSAASLRETLQDFFRQYHLDGYVPHDPYRLDEVRIDQEARTLRLYPNEPFYGQPFTSESVGQIYARLSRLLPKAYRRYRVVVYGKHETPIEELVPNLLREEKEDRSRLWGKIRYTGQPWVKNASRPYRVTKGLEGAHLMVTPSHGRYYRNGKWAWQRPTLFCTCEDLLTQSFVNPFLIPMLEKAGAVVASARERDPQPCEAVVDNDAPQRQGQYSETQHADNAWRTVTASAGFAAPAGLFNDAAAPFASGSAREVGATSRRTHQSTAEWMPDIPRAGRYAVYVSYVTRPNSVPDAHYTVYHKGGRTQFRVNQRMGGSTWVYLGTFAFDEGSHREGRVVLTNESDYRGVVTADGVRFGGGVGQSERGQAGTSGFPRFLEGSRYYAQWCGLPDTLFNKDGGDNDYNDDIRCRSYLLNFLGGGSCYMPGTQGRGVPFELALAVHSDAGVRSDQSVYGTLGICTTVDGFGNREYVSGLSRNASSDLVSLIKSSMARDLSHTFRITWTQRERWDRNYGETRVPDVPAAIIETLSHQNFTDMKFAHDPTFKFFLSRAIYKGILQYVNAQHGERDVVVQPLPVHAFSALLTADGEAAELAWEPTPDPLEPSAVATDYVLYTRVNDGDYDNGQLVGNNTRIRVTLSPGYRYSFRIAAVNAGGESFPSEELSVYRAPRPQGQILIVNGFERLSGPAWRETATQGGFDLEEDLGVTYGQTAAYAGRQINFDRDSKGDADEDLWGHSGNELEGQIFAGNTFDYPALHGRSVAAMGAYSYSSCSGEAFRKGYVTLSPYAMIDYIAGLQRDVPYNLHSYKTFDADTRSCLTAYLNGGGRLLVSGAFIGSDMQRPEEQAFLRDMLHCQFAGTARSDTSSYVRGLNLRFRIVRHSSATRYGAPAPDALTPVSADAFSAFAYDGGQSAGCAYPGRRYRVLTMGFPFECIEDATVRDQAMAAIVRFLLE